MRTRSTLTRAVFGAAVAAALAFGVTSATAAGPPAAGNVGCPGYVSSAQACTDCCASWHGAYGFWDPASGYCNCAL